MTMLFDVADNSGAKVVGGISIRCKKKFTMPRLGEIIRVSVKQSDPKSSIKKGTKHLAVISALRMPQNRKNGMNVRFSKNMVVILNPEGEAMLATRVLYPVADEVRAKFPDIISKAREVY